MKPSWDRLAKTFAKSKHVVIADVDCTAGGKSVCSKAGVKGYPTIKYYIDGVQRDYNGGRDFESLKKHVETKLGPPPPPCEVAKAKRQETCSQRELKYITKFEDDADAIEEELQKLKATKKKKEKKGNKKFVGYRWVNKRVDLLKQMKKMSVKAEL